MTEEELRLYRLQQARLANEPAKYQSEVGFLEGLLGKTSLEEQHQIMGNRYPDRGKDLRSWGEVPFTETATNILNYIPGVQIGPTADEWATQQVDLADQNRATAQRNMLHRAEGNALGIGTPSYRHIPEEKGIVSTAFDSVKKYFKDFDSPTKGVCTLPSGLQTQQLDRAACDAAGGTFNSPQMIYDNVLQQDGFFSEGIPGAINAAGQQLSHIRDAMNEAQINDNKMQKAGLNWTPDKIAWIEKYGINNLPGTQRDDTGGDTKETAVGRDTIGYRQEGLLSPDELQLRYPQRYADNAAANQGIFDAATKAAEGRDVTGVSGILPLSFMESEKARIAALQQGTDARFDRRMGDDRMAAASVWADRAIDEQEAGQWANQQIDAQEASQAAAKAQRMAAIQAGIDADAGRTTQENYELAAGIEWERPSDVTAETIIETVTAAADSYDADADNAEWVDSALRGEGIFGKFLDIIGLVDGETVTEDGQEKPALTETETNTAITAIADLAEQSKGEAVIEGKQDGLLATNETATSLLDVPATDAVVDTSKNIFTTAPASTEGFTMDRLKNPFSPENKKWWLGGGGGIPGNNRAVEFFNTLAYIGTPLKYRPSQTPSESLQDRKIKHMNNLMDYKAASSTSDPTFSALRAAVPSYNEIKDVITPRLTEAFDFGWFGRKSDEEENSLEGQITATAAEIRARMIAMAMAGQTSTVEKEMAKLIAEAKEAEEKRKAAEAARIAAERAAKDDNDEPGVVDKAMSVFKGFF